VARPRSDIQHRILGAAAERFLHDGVDGASLRQIAQEAGTSVGMVSYYFATKDDLFVAVVEDKYRKLLGDITAALAPDAPFEAQVLRLYARFAALDDDEFRVLRVVLREALVASPRMPALLARFSHGHVPVVLGAVARAMATGEVRVDLHPAAVVAGLISSGLASQFFLRLAAPALPAPIELPSREDMARAMRDVLMRGVGAPDAAAKPAKVTAPTKRRGGRKGGA
jgi:AcrR family transcriptional regulator